ncbi:MAG: cytochrome c [Solirubrobacterales bacterium]|nr:cytochrome c [Solirubrobacterales bacterium]
MRKLIPTMAAALMLAGCGTPKVATHGPRAPRTGHAIFSAAGCASCHTLGAAGASGDVGPNLDQAKPSAAQVAAKLRSGGGGMPSFSGRLSPSQINTLAHWVASVASGK